MSGPSTEVTGLLFNAEVLIDYVDADESVVVTIGQQIAPIHIPTPVLDEVDQVDEERAASLGLHLVEPTLAQVAEALPGPPTTSFQDRLCLVVARDGGWTCVTNDKQLRKACEAAGVSLAWGLEPLAWLVAESALKPARALAVAEAIRAANRFITRDIIRRFRKQIGL
jgi:hypothetical protein